MLPPAELMAKMPKQDSTTSTKTKQANPTSHSLPLVIPRYGGKMRLPAPKNMAKSAKPIINESFFISRPFADPMRKKALSTINATPNVAIWLGHRIATIRNGSGAPHRSTPSQESATTEARSLE